MKKPTTPVTDPYDKRITVATLRTMGKTYGLRSYAEIQRRALAMNRALGTHYSPKDVYRWEIGARRYGRTTAAYKALESVKGVRADRPYTPTFDDAVYFTAQQFGALAARVPQIRVLLEAKPTDFMDRAGNVWREEPVGDGSRSVWRNITTSQIRTDRPAEIKPVTPQNIREAIYKIRDVVDKSGGGSNVYEGYIDIYLADL